MITSAICGLIPVLASGSQYLEKGLGYVGITVALILIWMLLRYVPR